jgi:hypothetical protein
MKMVGDVVPPTSKFITPQDQSGIPTIEVLNKQPTIGRVALELLARAKASVERPRPGMSTAMRRISAGDSPVLGGTRMTTVGQLSKKSNLGPVPSSIYGVVHL